MQREGLRDIVTQSWQDQMTNIQTSIMEALSRIRKAISHWKRRTKPNSAFIIQEIQQRLDQLTQEEKRSDKRKAKHLPGTWTGSLLRVTRIIWRIKSFDPELS